MSEKVLVAMSGGVDSSVAALLVKQRGDEPIGVTMKLYDNEQADMCNTKTCCSLKDVEDARAVAARLDMPYYVVNFKEGFKEKVIDKFSETYLEGATPNPCIDCNRFMKFGTLVERAKAYGCTKAVTGHYAIVERDEETGECRLRKAADPSKDQTYVLYFLNQEQLSFLDFPLGKMIKTDARDLAEENGLINARKHDSQDICFVPDGNYARVIDEYLEEKQLKHIKTGPGDFVNLQGEVIGTHKGFYHYTIGQRKGLGISAAEPLYVVAIHPDKNEVVLGSNDDLMTKTVRAKDFSFINQPGEGVTELPCSAKIRYRAKETPGLLHILGDGMVEMEFDEPVRAVTSGQSLVIYDGDYCLGGGIIL